MEQVTIHSLVLGIAEPMAAMHLRHQVEAHPRFHLVGIADNAVQTLFLAGEKKPAVVLMADASPGVRGREILADLAVASPNSLVIITTPGDPRSLIGQPAVAESVAEHDSNAVLAALSSLADFLDAPEGEDDPNRRHEIDRRMRQDWSQVFAERRSGDRRQPSA